METSTKDYSAFYSPQLVMSVLNRAFSKAGLDVVSRVLQLYYLAKSPDLPVWAKASVFAALGYFVVSPDAVQPIRLYQTIEITWLSLCLESQV